MSLVQVSVISVRFVLYCSKFVHLYACQKSQLYACKKNRRKSILSSQAAVISHGNQKAPINNINGEPHLTPVLDPYPQLNTINFVNADNDIQPIRVDE